MSNPDEFAEPICVHCDYSLIGLPPNGNCPECGTPIDSSIISLRGWGSAGLANVRSTGVVKILLFDAAIIGFWLLLQWRVRQFLASSFFMILVLILSGFQLFLRWTRVSDQNAPLRLRLCERGFEQRLGSGPLKITRWNKDMIFRVRIGKKRDHHMTISWRFLSLHGRVHPLDFHFNAEIQTAQVLKQRVSQWVKAAGGIA